MNILNKIKYIIKNKKVIVISCISLSIIIFIVFYIIYNKDNIVYEEVPLKEIAIVTETPSMIEETLVYVDIKGKVDKPGVYAVSSNSRVKDVIEAAGGLLSNANTRYINLSKIVEDQMVIIIYSNEEIDALKEKDIQTYIEYIEKPCECQVSNDACIENDDNSNTSNLININTATLDELMTLSGIGESKAKAIISYREENGNFNTIEDIKNVSGISDATFNNIKENITT